MKSPLHHTVARSLLLIIMMCVSLHATAQIQLPKNTYAIVNNATTEVVCESATSAVKKETLSITILNAKGRSMADFDCMCDKFSSLRKFSGEVIDKNGKVIRKIKRNDLGMTEYSSGLTSDDYMYYYECQLPSYPITVRYEWEVKYKDGLIGFPTFVPQTNYNMAVAQADYSLSIPPGVECRHMAINTSAEVKEERKADGTTLITASLSNLHPLEKEPFGATPSERIPRILFTPTLFSFDGHKGDISSWQSYGKWQRELLIGRDELPQEAKEKVLQLTAPYSNERDKVKALYNHLAATTRYVSIQLGIGGLQPSPASEVYRTGFGDCKALSNYMAAMLKVIGIPSVYTVISTTNKELLDDYSSATQMNHVILQVPLKGDTLWLECTNPELPFGYVHNSIAGHQALLIRNDGGQLTQLPTYADSLNTQEKNIVVSLATDGSAEIVVNEIARLFQYESTCNFAKLDDARQKEQLRTNMNLRNAVIGKISVNEKKESSPQIEIDYTLQTNQYGNKTGNRLFIPTNVFRQGSSLANSNERIQDVHIGYGYKDSDRIKIVVPEEYVIEAIPQDITIETELGTFTSTITQTAGAIDIIHCLYIRSGVYPKEKYTELIGLYKSIAQQYSNQIVLRKEG